MQFRCEPTRSAPAIVIQSLVCQLLADAAALPSPLLWAVRIGVPLAAILISSGFFFSMLPTTATQPGGAVGLIYSGAVVLAISVVTLGVGLLRSQPSWCFGRMGFDQFGRQASLCNKFLG